MGKGFNILKSPRALRNYTTKWRYKVGVFETPQGDWIVRARKGHNQTACTISKHRTEKEAQKAYDKIIKTVD